MKAISEDSMAKMMTIMEQTLQKSLGQQFYINNRSKIQKIVVLTVAETIRKFDELETMDFDENGNVPVPTYDQFIT